MLAELPERKNQEYYSIREEDSELNDQYSDE